MASISEIQSKFHNTRIFALGMFNTENQKQKSALFKKSQISVDL